MVERTTDKSHSLYNNQDVMQMLHIKDKFLKKLRDNGFIGYSHLGDKYWYTQEDVDAFLRRFHYSAFATSDVLPAGFVEGGNI